MGVRHAREYADILKDFTAAVAEIEDSYTFLKWSLRNGRCCLPRIVMK